MVCVAREDLGRDGTCLGEQLKAEAIACDVRRDREAPSMMPHGVFWLPDCSTPLASSRERRLGRPLAPAAC